MRKIYFFLMAVALMGTSQAKADVFTPYNVDFENTISTSDHDFKVATGWGHIVDYSSGWSRTYVNYSQTDDGVDGSKCLNIGSQSVYSWGGSKTLNDLLVTPKLTGKVTLQVKASKSNDGEIAFYNVSEAEDGTLTMGDKLTGVKGASSISNSGYVTVTLPHLDGQRIGIRGHYVYIDNLQADTAEYTLNTSVKMMSVSISGGRDIDCDETQHFHVKFSVPLQNTGDTEINSATKGYTLTLYHDNGEERDSIASWPQTATIAPGATVTLTIDTVLAYADYPGYQSFYIKEGISGTQRDASFTSVRYAPKMSIQNMDNYDYPDNGSTIDFGEITENKSITLKIWNNGAADLHLTSIATTGEFSTSTDTLLVKAHDWETFDLTALSTNSGVHEGSLTLKSNDTDWTFKLTSSVPVPAGINNVKANDTKVNTNIYNLQGQYIGQSLATLPHGVYVVNGKKIVI